MYVTAALKITITKLGNVLMKNLAILFPELHRCFLRMVIDEANKASLNLTEAQITEAFPKQYFFSFITSFFEKHLVCLCKHRRHGVLLYRRGSDLGEVLSKTLQVLPNSSMTLLELKPTVQDTSTIKFKPSNIQPVVQESSSTKSKQENIHLLNFCNNT